MDGWIIIPFIMLCLLGTASYGRTSLSLVAGKSPISYLNEAADFIRYHTRPEDQVLSYNNALVVQAGRQIVPGYEMHIVTYDPRWDEERCRTFRILTQTRLEKMLQEQRIALVVMSENAFIGRFPDFYNPGEKQMRDSFLEILEHHYIKIKEYPELGYFNTRVDMYLARSRLQKGGNT